MKTNYPNGWTEAEAWEAYATSATGAESGRSFEGFIKYWSELPGVRQWWQAPESGEEYHTARVWEAIAKAAAESGDLIRAAEAQQAAEFEARNSQVD